MNTVKYKNPCYECHIHRSGICKSKNEKCQNCKDRYDYIKLIKDGDILTNLNYNYIDNHTVHI